MNAGSIMSTTKIVAPANATGRELVFYMDLGGFSAVPITDAAGRIMGIVSEKDLMQALVAGTALDKVTARNLMSGSVVTVEHDSPLEDMVRIFAGHNFHNLPVMKLGKLVGMVTRREVLRAAANAEVTTVKMVAPLIIWRKRPRRRRTIGPAAA